MSRHFGYPLSLLAFSVGVGLWGCGGGGNTAPLSMTNIAKASMNSGDAQSGTVGQPLANPLQVLVTESGAPSAGVTVTWSTGAVGGSVTPASGPTDANGVAMTTWNLGTGAGVQTAQATLAAAIGSPVPFTATAAAGPAASLSKGTGDNQTGDINTQLAAPVQAKVADQFGNGVAGVDVMWSASGGTVSAVTVPTDGAGISPVQVTLGSTAGPVTITAAATGFTALTFNATAQVPPPIPTQAAVVVGNIFFRSGHNGTSNPAVDTVAVGGTVTWTWTNTGMTSHGVQSLGPPSFTSSAIKMGNGQTYAVTFSQAGTYQYDCAVHGLLMTGQIVVR